MGELKQATESELRAIIDEFSTLSWPVASSGISAIGRRLGWGIDYESGRRISFKTSLTEDSYADVSLRDGDVAQIKLDASARIAQSDDTQGSALNDSFVYVRDQVEAILGEPARSTSGEFPRVSWDLPNRGRVAVQRLGEVVQLVILQERYADVERFEESRGIRDDRDPEGDLD